MTRRETVLRKLHTLTSDEIAEAIDKLTHHVRARLRYRSLADRTKSGAHGEMNLGMNAIDYYVGESVKRLYAPDGWDWKFEKFSLAEQLMRIANKLISDKVAEYERKQEELPSRDDRDIEDIYNAGELDIEDSEYDEQVYSKLIQLAQQVAKGSDQLEHFTRRYFEKASFEEIATEMNIEVKDVYVLKRKLVRKMLNFKEQLT